jgi:hypothetical protein
VVAVALVYLEYSAMSEQKSTDASGAIPQLIQQWRETARVEREQAKGEYQREKDLLEHSADTFELCADELEALLKELR